MKLFESIKIASPGIVILGCAGFAPALAEELLRRGHSVRMIADRAPEQFSGRGGWSFQADDATRPDVLNRAELGRTELVAIATENDNVNLMVAQYVKEVCSVHEVIALLNDPSRVEVFREFGISAFHSATVCGGVIFRQMFQEEKAGVE